ncbi:MAG: hypothetical protein AUJ72_00755 [Candidatus Omnitrophica bacterium CG1_02_46_14]|nr:MAG: hypothetical protein AUJ72_00755 [Candidatus Omnitrophica bacterium CG1_02_46_14]
MFILYGVVLFCALLLSYFLTYFFIKLSQRFNFIDYPTERKDHHRPVPLLGGVSVFCSFWAVVFLGILVAQFPAREIFAGSSVQRLIDGVVSVYGKILGIFAGGLVILIVGLIDDKADLLPIQKFFGQMVAALILMKMGFTISLFVGTGVLGYTVTFVWILLIMNAFNFIDSLDGHCAGIALIASMMFFWITQIIQQPMVAFFLATFMGALLGFLPHNFKPAKIFLGDNGSLFVGYLMAAFTLLCKYQEYKFSYVTIFIPILIFGVPIYDTVSVVVVRTIRGIPFWKGDRNHFAHRLVKMGMSERAAVIFSYLVQATIGLIALLTTQVTAFGSILIGFVFTGIISLIAFLEYYAARRIQIAERLSQEYRRRKDDFRGEEEKNFL